ncbi:MAG: MlaD family protein [Phycisphaerales bacterium]
MATRTTTNNFKAGIFLIVALVVFVAMAAVFGGAGDRYFTKRTTYVFRFDLPTGGMGLKKDSMVKIGGQVAGFVVAVDFKKPPQAVESPVRRGQPQPVQPDQSGKLPPNYIYVTAKVRTDLMLFEDAVINLELPLLGSVSTINIPFVGGEARADRPASPPLTEWGVIDGSLAPPAFLAQAGYGNEQKTQMQSILERGEQISTQVGEMIDTFNQRLGPALDSAQESVNNVRDLTGEFAKNRQEWAASVGDSLRNVRTATAEAADRVIEAKTLLALVKDGIEHNRPFIDRIFFNAAEAVEKVNTDLLASVRDTLADGRKAVANVLDITERARPVVAEAVPEIRRILANGRLASDQLKLAMVEIRRTPWRLLYQPTRKELEEELMYDRVRTYAAAVSDLRAVSESLAAAVDGTGSGPGSPLDRNQIEAMTKDMAESFERYRQAEKQFLDKLLADKP